MDKRDEREEGRQEKGGGEREGERRWREGGREEEEREGGREEEERKILGGMAYLDYRRRSR